MNTLFTQVPSTISNQYIIFATEDPDPNKENHAIDESSPSDDKHIAELALHEVGSYVLAPTL